MPGHGTEKGRQSERAQKHVNLNTAPIEEIETLPMIGRQRAELIVKFRPYNSWEDVEKIPEFSQALVRDLKEGGATVGESEGE